jgi:hypothetical protein
MTIIVCSGCSFTHGSELWEEKNVFGYKDIKSQYEAFIATKDIPFNPVIDETRRNLSYTGTIQKELGCTVFNIGHGGSSQQEIMQKTITSLSNLKKSYPKEDIVCIMQDTFPNRLWIWQEQFGKNFSIALSQIEQWYPGADSDSNKQLEAYEIKDLLIKYVPEELMHSEYYMQSLAVQNYCLSNNIKFMHFHIWDKQYEIQTKNMDMNLLWESFFDETYCVKDTMLIRLERYFGDRSFYLPGLHMNCHAHEVMGKWLVEELKQRGLV